MFAKQCVAIFKQIKLKFSFIYYENHSIKSRLTKRVVSTAQQENNKDKIFPEKNRIYHIRREIGIFCSFDLNVCRCEPIIQSQQQQQQQQAERQPNEYIVDYRTIKSRSLAWK